MQNKNYSIYSAGKFITTNNILEVVNPFDKSLVAKTYLADESILNEAINAALIIKEEVKFKGVLKFAGVVKLTNVAPLRLTRAIKFKDSIEVTIVNESALNKFPEN